MWRRFIGQNWESVAHAPTEGVESRGQREKKNCGMMRDTCSFMIGCPDCYNFNN